MDITTTDTQVSRAEQPILMKRLWVRREIVNAYKKIAAGFDMPMQNLVQRVLLEGLENFGVFDQVPTPPPPPPERPLPKLAEHKSGGKP